MRSLCSAAAAALLMLCTGCETTDPGAKPPPPPPPGSDLSTQPWARGEKDWELGRPAFMPGTR